MVYLKQYIVFNYKGVVKFLLSTGQFSSAKNVFREQMCLLTPHNRLEIELELQKSEHWPIKERDAKTNLQDYRLESIQKSAIIASIAKINLESTSAGVDIWNEDKDYEISLLSDIGILLKTEKRSYIFVLARALQINSEKYSITQKLKYSKIAMKVLDLSISFVENGLQYAELRSVSQYLFKYCFTSITQKKYHIFYCIVPNVVILQIISNEQLLHYFSLIIQSQITELLKLKMIIQFYKAHCWLFNLTNKFCQFSFYNKKLEKLLSSFFKNTSIKKQLSQILKLVFTNDQEKIVHLDSSQNELNYQERQILTQIQILNIYLRAIKNWNDDIESNGLQLKGLLANLEPLIRKDSQKSYFCFEYYHLFCIFMYYNDQKSKQLLWLINKYASIFEGNIVLFVGIELTKCSMLLTRSAEFSLTKLSVLINQNKGITNNFIIQRVFINEIRGILISKHAQISQGFSHQKEVITLKLLQIFQMRIIHFDLDELKKLIRIIPKVISFKLQHPEFFENSQLRCLQNNFKDAYLQLRVAIRASGDHKSPMYLILALVFLLVLLEKYTILDHISKMVFSTLKRVPKLSYIFYEALIRIMLSYKFLQRLQPELIRQIYSNYLTVIEQNDDFSRIFHRKLTFHLIFSYMYKNLQPEELAGFLNKISRYLLFYKRKEFVETFIDIITKQLLKVFQDKVKIFHYYKTNLNILPRIEFVTINPYNSLLFAKLISLRIIQASPRIYISIFRSFRHLLPIAQKYVCKTIYSHFLDMTSERLRKRKIKQLLLLKVKNSQFNIKVSTFLRMHLRKLKKQNTPAPCRSAIRSKLRKLYESSNQFLDVSDIIGIQQKECTNEFDKLINKYISFIK